MASNQNKTGSRAGKQGGTHEQHVAAGRQSHKNDAARQADTSASEQSAAQSGAGVQGGTPEQHAAAGRQSHKNDKKR